MKENRFQKYIQLNTYTTYNFLMETLPHYNNGSKNPNM